MMCSILGACDAADRLGFECVLQTVALKVAMMCGGCEGAVRRVLNNMPGVLQA